MIETRIKEKEFHCPKCGKAKLTSIEFSKGCRIDQFDFYCECGCNFKYQYGNVSHNGEMSTYKNPYMNEILDEVSRIVDSEVN